MDALLLEVEQTLGAYGFYLRDDDIRLMLVDDGGERITVEHGKNFTFIGYLHGRGIIIAVTSNDILSGTLGRNRKLTAQFT